MSDGARESRHWRALRRWLRPGTGIKRWLLVVFLGELLLAVAGALVIRQLVPRRARATAPRASSSTSSSLQFLPDWLRPVVVLAVGVGHLPYGLRRLMGVLLEPFPARTEPLVELVYQKRSLARGPRIVAIGGGTGLSTLLRGLKRPPATSPRSSPWPTTAARRASCARSWASRPWATSATASPRSPTPSRP